jgi:predicted transcriptional regulator
MGKTMDAKPLVDETDSTYHRTNLIELTAEIVSAYVSHNSLPSAEITALIEAVKNKLEQIRSGRPSEAPLGGKQPAVGIKRSIAPDYLVCLEDGKKFKSLKRHLRAEHDMTPDQYRQKWGLSDDYPMVAPNYAQSRSQLAKTMGLGHKTRKSPKKTRGRQSS